ncbi:D-serine dehydratase [compost metagenome]
MTDEELYRLLAIAYQQERVRLEPSALAGAPGMVRVLRDRAYLERIGVTSERLANATHLVWGTGGSMVPAEEFAAYVEKGRG